MGDWDLTAKIGPYLDRHLVFPLLEFLSVKEYYDETDLQKGKLDLLSNTCMVDFAMDVHKGLYPDQDVPPTLVDKRAKVVEQFKQLQAETDSVMKILNEPEVIRQIQQSRDSKQLLDKVGGFRCDYHGTLELGVSLGFVKIFLLTNLFVALSAG